MSEAEYIYDVTEQDFAEKVMEPSQTRPVLVDFWAEWCAPCKTLMPLLSQLATEYAGQFVLAKINVDNSQQLAQMFQVRSVPTVKMVRNGQIVDEFSGALPEGQLREFLQRHLGDGADGGNALLQAVEQALSEGDSAQALQLLDQAMAEQPDNADYPITKLQLLVQLGELDAAESMLQALPEGVAGDERLDGIRASIKLARAAGGNNNQAELLAAVEQNPDDLEAHYQLALAQAAAGEHEAALERLLLILGKQRSFNEGAARQAMIDIFNLLGGEHPLVSRYRRAMATLLN